MKIETRRNGEYLQVDISINGFYCEMGLLSISEAEEMRETLSTAIDELTQFIESEAMR